MFTLFLLPIIFFIFLVNVNLFDSFKAELESTIKGKTNFTIEILLETMSNELNVTLIPMYDIIHYPNEVLNKLK